MSKLSDAIIDGISNEVGNAMDQMYYANEQMVTGQTIADRSSRDMSQDEMNAPQKEHSSVEQSQPEPQPQPQPDIEQER